MRTKQSMLSQVHSPTHATIDRPDFCELIPNNGFPPAPTLCNQLQFVQLSLHWTTMWILLYNCTFCCCDFDISLIAGFLLPPPPAGSGPCNIVSRCISMYYDAFQYMLYPASRWLCTVFTLLAHNFLCSASQYSHISRHFHTLQGMNYIAHNSLARDRM